MEEEMMAKYYKVNINCPNPACNAKDLECIIQLTWDEQNILDHLTEKYRDVPSSLLTAPGIRIKRWITCAECDCEFEGELEIRKEMEVGWDLWGINADYDLLRQILPEAFLM